MATLLFGCLIVCSAILLNFLIFNCPSNYRYNFRSKVNLRARVKYNWQWIKVSTMLMRFCRLQLITLTRMQLLLHCLSTSLFMSCKPWAGNWSLSLFLASFGSIQGLCSQVLLHTGFGGKSVCLMCNGYFYQCDETYMKAPIKNRKFIRHQAGKRCQKD